jgi:hypothetical protein
VVDLYISFATALKPNGLLLTSFIVPASEWKPYSAEDADAARVRRHFSHTHSSFTFLSHTTPHYTIHSLPYSAEDADAARVIIHSDHTTYSTTLTLTPHISHSIPRHHIHTLQTTPDDKSRKLQLQLLTPPLFYAYDLLILRLLSPSACFYLFCLFYLLRIHSDSVRRYSGHHVDEHSHRGEVDCAAGAGRFRGASHICSLHAPSSLVYSFYFLVIFLYTPTPMPF